MLILGTLLNWVRKLGTTLTIVIGLVLFYEGVPFLNFWPVNQVPLVGWFIEGEIDRRLEYKIQLAVSKEREAWRQALEKAKRERDTIVQEKNKQIREVINQGIKEVNKVELEHEQIINNLEKSIEEANNEDTCNILNSPVPDSVFRNIN